MDPGEYELEFVEPAIRAHFAADMAGRYVPGLPCVMQMTRQLDRLAQQGKEAQRSAGEDSR